MLSDFWPQAKATYFTYLNADSSPQGGRELMNTTIMRLDKRRAGDTWHMGRAPLPMQALDFGKAGILGKTCAVVWAILLETGFEASFARASFCFERLLVACVGRLKTFEVRSAAQPINAIWQGFWHPTYKFISSAMGRDQNYI